MVRLTLTRSFPRLPLRLCRHRGRVHQRRWDGNGEGFLLVAKAGPRSHRREVSKEGQGFTQGGQLG